ncbi:MAG TPA: N-acetylornithine carbamoyltransferase [Planctomycetota bacterium]|nr:N-acetylornithine carbamoyltransferase [Planctomycetota bacterium]
MPNFKGRSFISTLDFKPAELGFLLDRARALKKTRGKKGKQPLAGKSVAMVFFNPSLRTRVSFEVGIAELGGTAVTMSVGSESWSLEYREGAVMDQDKTEHIKDAAQVLSRYVDAICVRSFPGMKSHDEDMADPVISSFRKYATVPVINMESALWHPCQGMADAMTLEEKLGKLKGKKVTLTWAYHPKALPMAVGNSFAAIVSQLGADLTIAHPPEFALEQTFLDQLPRAPRIVHSKAEGLAGAQAVYAKSWGGSSFYGKWEEEKKIREGLRSWICDTVPKGAVFLHCLPVRRNVEVADAVLDASAIYDEAENRLHVQKAILSELV